MHQRYQCTGVPVVPCRRILGLLILRECRQISQLSYCRANAYSSAGNLGEPTQQACFLSPRSRKRKSEMLFDQRSQHDT